MGALMFGKDFGSSIFRKEFAARKKRNRVLSLLAAWIRFFVVWKTFWIGASLLANFAHHVNLHGF